MPSVTESLLSVSWINFVQRGGQSAVCQSWGEWRKAVAFKTWVVYVRVPSCTSFSARISSSRWESTLWCFRVAMRSLSMYISFLFVFRTHNVQCSVRISSSRWETSSVYLVVSIVYREQSDFGSERCELTDFWWPLMCKDAGILTLLVLVDNATLWYPLAAKPGLSNAIKSLRTWLGRRVPVIQYKFAYPCLKLHKL
jgi:hypothetical protein